MTKIFDILLIIVYTLLIYTLSSCISIFDPPGGMKERTGILVVEGVITEEGTKITLGRTIKLNEELSQSYLFENINNAIIHVIDENHTIIAVAQQAYNWGPYVVNERFSFVPGMKYALDIRTTDNKQYQSSFLTPVRTPDIDEVTWQINEDQSIDIFVSTHDPENQINYYRWDFEEDWEIRSSRIGPLRYDPVTQSVIPHYYNTIDNRYYCWITDHSKSLLFASSVKNMEAAIKNHKIHSFEPGSSRYSYLYSILVRQYGLDQEACLYFENVQRNMDESSSIFAPQPSEKSGNIQCLSDPDETVIGYITASEVKTYRLFIPMAELRFNNLEDQYSCTDVPDLLFNNRDAAFAFYYGYGILSETDRGYEYAMLKCLDCSYRGGTKTKPEFWPNDHQ